MHLRPDLVKTDQLDADGMDKGAEKPGGAIYGATDYQRFDQKTMHGGVGDPRPSSAAAGKAMIDASIADVVKTVLSIKAAEPFQAFAERRKEKHRGLWRQIPKL
jgi:creatinine amidohydrolase/Fe(II)-dependent formamide hydrolase-like protein